ncbi:MAG: hypothetical protein DCC65_05070 [Planctomycetota bacterium]|nr:MAG: hypothetical protein DCC65_05070 [Planctomycetota bacterium]
MGDRSEKQLEQALGEGDEAAFARLYDRCHERVRLVAWRVSHRSDWLDEILNESWCRAYEQRRAYDSSRPFVVWMAGIVQNVYREHCRKSPTTTGDRPDERISFESPETVASEAELLSGLNECMGRLSPEDAVVVRRRYFDGATLRVIAEELRIPESTLRSQRLPAIMEALRRCMTAKGLEISEIFSAQEGPEGQ